MTTPNDSNNIVGITHDAQARGAVSALFRAQARAAKQAQWLGTVLLVPRVSHTVFTAFAGASVLAIMLLLFFAEYTRTARISGWLVPSEGMMRVFAPRAGVVTSLHVKEGTAVRQGDPLVTLSTELESTTRGATQMEIIRSLEARRDSLATERAQQAIRVAQQEHAMSARLAALSLELRQIEREIAVHRSRVAIAARGEALHRKMRDQGFISELRFHQAESEKLEQLIRLGALERSRTAIQRERLTIESELRDLPLKGQQDILAIERSISQLDQERAEVESRREIVISAPRGGIVTAIQTVLGGQAGTTVPLMSVVPPNAQLEAHLYSPSRAVGFVRLGQGVRLRYASYPYQKFGHYEGEVHSVSHAAVSPAELPPQLASLTSLMGGSQGNGVAEPIYRVAVHLAVQSVTAYGKPIPLQPGMLLEADVRLEKRRLYEWVLEPLYTLTGKWQ